MADIKNAGINYNAPTSGSKSTIDDQSTSDQLQTFLYLRKALIDSKKEQYFMPLASTIGLPMHFGKEVKRYRYYPLLDDRNKNDQGIDASGAQISPGSGNLYGSSRDIGTITGKLPTLTEQGGRVNRVGFKRTVVKGSIRKFGFFYDFTKEALGYDSDKDLNQHLAREAINGATQITEACLQMDLLNSAGVKVYCGGATQDSEVTAEGGTASLLTYDDLRRLDMILTNNRCPRQTRINTGSTNIDTKTTSSARIAYVSQDLLPVLEDLKDKFNNKVFVPLHQYADAVTPLNGEVGQIGAFRFVVVPEMLKWAGAGAQETTNPGYQSTTKSGHKHYDVYPILVVGDDSFNTIGFQTGSKAYKFDIITKMPGRETAGLNEPYGETGFTSIKWYYGFLCNRPEWIGMIKTVAPI